MKRAILTTILCTLMVVFCSLSFGAANEKRMLTGITIDDSDKSVRVRLALENNNGRPLGKVYYSKKMIRLVLTNTGMKDTRRIKVKGDGEYITMVDAKKRKKYVTVYVKLAKRVRSIMEHMAFEPYAQSSIIELRKPAYYATAAIEPERQVKPDPVLDIKNTEEAATAPKKPGVSELIPLVAPEELRKLKEQDAAKHANLPQEKKDEISKKRKQTIDDLFGKKEETPKPVAKVVPKEQPKPATLDKEEEIKIGEDAPDLTGLYIMAASVLLIALLWFGLAKGKRVKFAGLDGDINILKSHNLGGKHRLLLVEIEGKRLLLSSNDKNINLISELDPGGEADQQFSDAVQPDNVHMLFGGGAEEQSAEIGANFGKKDSINRPSFFGNSDDLPLDSSIETKSENKETSDKTLRERLRTLRGRF